MATTTKPKSETDAQYDALIKGRRRAEAAREAQRDQLVAELAEAEKAAKPIRDVLDRHERAKDALRQFDNTPVQPDVLIRQKAPAELLRFLDYCGSEHERVSVLPVSRRMVEAGLGILEIRKQADALVGQPSATIRERLPQLKARVVEILTGLEGLS